jgi:hypothetical protein
MDTTRTTFLKKRLMSTVFDEVEGQFVDAGDRRRPECGRALGHLSRKARPGGEGGGGQGRPVRPARSGSLDGPRSQVVASHNRQGTPSGVPGCFGAGGHSGDLTTGAQNWAGQAVGFGCRTFLRPELVHDVFPATARRAALSSPASPGGGHVVLRARALAVSEPCSTGLLVGVSQPVEHQAEQLPRRRDPGDHRASPLLDAHERRGDGGAAVVAGDGFDRRPPHQRRALFGDLARPRLGRSRCACRPLLGFGFRTKCRPVGVSPWRGS